MLAPGGVLFGDDFAWPGVRHDVELFRARRAGELHFELLRADEANPHSPLLWLMQKPRV